MTLGGNFSIALALSSVLSSESPSTVPFLCCTDASITGTVASEKGATSSLAAVLIKIILFVFYSFTMTSAAVEVNKKIPVFQLYYIL